MAELAQFMLRADSFNYLTFLYIWSAQSTINNLAPFLVDERCATVLSAT